MHAIKGNTCQGLQYIDLFGQEVELTFSNKKKYTSWCGVSISILCLVLMTAMVTVRTQKLLTGDDPFFSATEVSSELMTIDIWKEGFMFALEDIDPSVGKLSVSFDEMGKDEEGNRLPYNSTEITMVNCRELQPGGKHEGELNNKKFDIDRMFNAIPGSDILCPIGLDSMVLQGVFDSDRFTFVKIAYTGCQLEDPEVNCASDKEISEKTVNFVTLNSQPNIFGRSKNSVIEFVQEMKNFYFIDPTHTQLSNIFYLESNLRLKENWWDFLEATEYDLQLFEHSYTQPLSRYIHPNITMAERSYIEFYLRADQKVRHYKREEYDILSYFGDIGGLLDIIFIFGFAISSVFVGRQLQAALVNRAYRLQRYNEDQTQYYKTKLDGRVTPDQSQEQGSYAEEVEGLGELAIADPGHKFEDIDRAPTQMSKKKSKSSAMTRTNRVQGIRKVESLTLPEKTTASGLITQDRRTMFSRGQKSASIWQGHKSQDLEVLDFRQGGTQRIKQTFKKDLDKQRKTLIDRVPKKQQLFYIYHLILNQRRIIYSQCDSLLYYFKCLCFRKARSLKRNQRTEKDYQMNKGINMLSQDLDIVNLIEMIKGYRVMKQVLFSKDDQVLLKLQSRDTINSMDEDESDLGHESANMTDSSRIEQMGKIKRAFSGLSHMYSDIQEMEDEKALQMRDNVKQLLKRYEGRKLNDTEFRILQGVLSTDFGLLEHIQKQQKRRKTEILKLKEGIVGTELQKKVLEQAMQVVRKLRRQQKRPTGKYKPRRSRSLQDIQAPQPKQFGELKFSDLHRQRSFHTPLKETVEDRKSKLINAFTTFSEPQRSDQHVIQEKSSSSSSQATEKDRNSIEGLELETYLPNVRAFQSRGGETAVGSIRRISETDSGMMNLGTTMDFARKHDKTIMKTSGKKSSRGDKRQVHFKSNDKLIIQDFDQEEKE